MKVITKILNDNYINQYIDENTIFFDIETLGLSPKTTPIYLIGYLFLKENIPTITLLFAENRNEEGALLEQFAKTIKDFRKCITFNGSTFDIPFIESRAKAHNIDIDLRSLEHNDIYKFLKKINHLLGLSSLKQKSLESYLGIQREDKYNGGELINVYYRYEKYRNQKDYELLILHNLEDVEGMSYILPILNYKSLLLGEFYIDTLQPNISANPAIEFSGFINKPLPKPLTLILKDSKLEFKEEKFFGYIELSYLELKLFHKDIKNYVYLPMEDMTIPKELSSSLPKHKYEKSTKENCYTKVKGTFYKIPNPKLAKKIISKYNLSDNIYFFKEKYNSEYTYLLLWKNKSPDESELLDLKQRLKLILFLFIEK